MGKSGKPYHQSVKKIWKLNGQQKLKYYCQMCSKQCRDEHGFKAHCSSASHLAQMVEFASNPEAYINLHSEAFHTEFVQLLESRYTAKRVEANRVYQEIILNPEHIHINATKWTNLTNYVKYLGKEGFCKVEQDGEDWYITMPDKKLAIEREKVLKKAVADRNEEEREQNLLKAQILKASKAEEVVKGPAPTEIEAVGTGSIKMSLLKPGVVKKLKPVKLSSLASKSMANRFESPIHPLVLRGANPLTLIKLVNLMPVTVYSSSVPGSTKVRKETTRVQDILAAHKIEFTTVDVTQDNHLDEMFKGSGKKVLPQIFVDGVFKGLAEDFELANEDGKIKEFLGI